MELYSPVAEYDLETIGSVIYGLAVTAFVAVVSVFACFPESKLTLKIKKILKKVAPQLMDQPGYVSMDVNVCFLFNNFILLLDCQFGIDSIFSFTGWR